LATPDCYDYSVTTLREDYFEFLPKMLFYGKSDWLALKHGENCAFYTYGDVFFRSYHSSVSGIYFVFRKVLGSSTCKLNNTLMTFPNGTWLYANSLYADPNVCGYYVGVANAGSNNRTFQIIRASAKALTIGAIAAGTIVISWLF